MGEEQTRNIHKTEQLECGARNEQREERKCQAPSGKDERETQAVSHCRPSESFRGDTKSHKGGRLKQGRAAEGRGSHGTRLDSGPPARLPAPPSHRSTPELYSGGEMKSGHLQTSEHQKGQSPHTEPDNDQPPTHL